MDLNSIQLPAFLIVDLYKNTLVDTGTPAPIKGKPVPKTEPSWKYLGENKKNLLVAVDYPDAVHIPDKQLQFLTNLLVAIKYNLADVAVFNTHKQPDATNVTASLKSKVVILFGVTPEQMGIPVNFPHFQVQPFNGITYLFSPALQEIENDKLLKSKLWVCLKKIFNI